MNTGGLQAAFRSKRITGSVRSFLKKAKGMAVVAGLLAALLIIPEKTCAAGEAPKDEPITYYYGDLDINGTVTAEDALAILKYVVKLPSFDVDNELVMELADVDHVGGITAADALGALKVVVKLQTPEVYTPKPEPTETPAPFVASGVVWVAGDSIASSHDTPDYQVPIDGWGQHLASYMTADAVIHNGARSGRSSMSYLSTNEYKTMLKNIAAGDYLLISFGLNDEKNDPNLFTDPYGDSTQEYSSFAWYLKENYIEPARKAGAQPVLLSPVLRASFTTDGKLREQEGPASYAKSMERLVEEYANMGVHIPYIDLNEMTKEWFTTLGAEGTLAVHGVDAAGKADTTHFNAEGAAALAKMILDEVVSQQMELSSFVVTE